MDREVYSTWRSQMNAVMAVNVVLLSAALGSVIVMIDHMGRRTRGAVRWGAALTLVGIVAQIVGYFWHWESWTDTLFFGGASMCLIANLRFPGGAEKSYEEW